MEMQMQSLRRVHVEVREAREGIGGGACACFGLRARTEIWGRNVFPRSKVRDPSLRISPLGHTGGAGEMHSGSKGLVVLV